MPLGDFSSSSSHAHTTGSPLPPPYSTSDATNALQAFAEVNKALQARNARQSLPRRVPQGPREPRAPNPEILPYRPSAQKIYQLAQDTSQLYSPFMHAHPNQSHEVTNPRFSTASSPAALYPGKPALPSSNVRETGRYGYERYPRDSTNKGDVRPARPALKLITPSSPQWKGVNAVHRRERTFQAMGYQSTSLKDQSGCVIM